MLTNLTIAEEFNNRERTVILSVSFKWTQSVIIYGDLDRYEVYLSDVDMLRVQEEPANIVSNAEVRRYK